MSASAAAEHAKLIELANAYTKNRISAHGDAHRAPLIQHVTSISNRADGTAQLFDGLTMRGANAAASPTECGNLVRALCTGAAAFPIINYIFFFFFFSNFSRASPQRLKRWKRSKLCGKRSRCLCTCSKWLHAARLPTSAPRTTPRSRSPNTATAGTRRSTSHRSLHN